MCDVRVVERSQNLGFALEASQSAGIVSEGFRQNFERDIALQPGVARTVYLAHTACAESALNLVRPDLRAGPNLGNSGIRGLRRSLCQQLFYGAAKFRLGLVQS